MLRIFKKIFGRAGLNNFALIHDHNLLGKGQRLHLIMRDINQGQFELFMDFFELSPQMPFEVGIYYRQRFIKKNGGHIGADQSPSQRYFLFGVGGKSRGFLFKKIR